jgi:hypothetical protein
LSTIDIPGADVRPGDLAWRADGSLDPRPVETVLDGSPKRITLKIGTVVTDPIPASLYRFTRYDDSDRPCGNQHYTGLVCNLAPHSPTDTDHAMVDQTPSGVPFTRAFWNYGDGPTGLNGIRRIQ